jgi:threonine synthase
VQIAGDFDDAMQRVKEVSAQIGIYLVNSVNPFRLEGQKTIAFEMLEQRNFSVPDRVVVPGGNLGNSSAMAKGFKELFDLGLIERLPQLVIVQAEGANPLYRMWRAGAAELQPLSGASTLATAIKIGSPISWPKAVRGLGWSAGEVEQVGEQEIADAKAMIGRDGIGCEPASAVTLAGIKRLVASGKLQPDEDVVAILTGHALKDPDYTVNYHGGSLSYTDANGARVEIASHYASRLLQVPAEREAILSALAL